VTTSDLIWGIITERGCCKGRGALDMAAFKAEAAAGSAAREGACADIRSVGKALTESTVRAYICEREDLCRRVGPPEKNSEWKVREVGDGNINFVYIVEGPSGALCLKQALPFVRCVGESWPLTQERLKFEVQAMRYQAELCPEHVPAIYCYDPKESVMVMEYLPPPHTILRHSMNEGVIYPKMAQHMAEFLAKTLFRSSFLALPAEEFRANVVAYTNPAMCSLTEQVVFTEPLYDAAKNNFLRPQMDEAVRELWGDAPVKAAVTAMKEKFLSSTQAMLHGDVHTGSVMVSQENTYVIDAEFAFYGPIFFDVGKFIGNLLLYFFSLDGRGSESDPRDAQRRWALAAACELWRCFSSRFTELWDAEGLRGAMFPEESFGKENSSGPDAMKALQSKFMAELYDDCIRMAGVSMIRRVVGLAGVADLRDIADPEVRAVCERRALRLARRLLLEKTSGIDAVVAMADAERQDGASPYFAL